MGYQIGNICYADKQLAENVYFSQIAPVIDANGGLHQFILTKQGWTLNGQKITASLPECSLSDNFVLGSQLGWLLFSILVIVFGIKQIANILK